MRTGTVVGLVAPLALLVTAAAAEPVATDYAIDVTVVSSYVWRGDRVTASALAPATQPYAEVGFSPVAGGRLAVGAWTSALVTADAPAYELDPYLTYAAPWGPAKITAGYAVYLVAASRPIDTMHEASLQAELGDLAVVPSIGVAVDVVRTDGWYAWAALAHQVQLGPVTIATRLEVGGSDYAALGAGFQHATASSRLSHPFGRGFYVAATGALAYSGRSGQLSPTLAVGVGVSR